MEQKSKKTKETVDTEDNYYMNSTVGIKIVENNITSNGIMIIKKYYNDEIPMSEIKEKIESNNYIAICDYIDKDGIEKILQLYDKLEHEGIKCELYEHDKITTMEFLNNLLTSYEETEKEVEEDMDRVITIFPVRGGGTI